MTTERSRTLVLVRRLGSGGFGEVYLGELYGADGFSRPVAVKTLLPKAAARPDVIARHRDEARLLGRLAHENIVQCLDLTEFDGKIAILLEYVEGVSAQTLLDILDRLPPRAAAELVADAAAAVHFAWAEAVGEDGAPLRVIHRDIKPSNLLINTRGVVKVLDFGIARANMVRGAKTEGVQLGTSLYLPPEAVLRGEATHANDVYALGVTLLQLVLGPEAYRLPLAADAHAAALAELVAKVSLNCGSDALAQLVARMVAHAPTERPSAGEVFEQLTLLALSLPGPSLPAFARQQIPPLLMAAASSMPISASYQTYAIETPLEQAAVAPPPGRRWPWWVALGVASAMVAIGAVLSVRDALPRCGDGVVQRPEACDDANSIETDGCTATCEANAVLLDGVSAKGKEWNLGSDIPCTTNASCVHEVPATPIRLAPFWMQRNEMTVEGYQTWAEEHNGAFPNQFGEQAGALFPMRDLTFEQAQAMCRSLGGDLPTEAQWEFAARSGGRGQQYPWGDEKPTCALALLGDHNCSHGEPRRICSRPAGNSAQGICDLAGNVWEWVRWSFATPADDEGMRPYPGVPDNIVQYREDDGAYDVHGSHAIRGGGYWQTSLHFNRARARFALPEGVREKNIGFRCAWAKQLFPLPED
jgi:cysteine-rich repeat protein